MYVLSHSQREVLYALITLYKKSNNLVKSKDIAEFLGKDEGTIRNIIASLKALGLVISKTGPAGGYRPTLKAHEYLKFPPIPFVENVRVFKDNQELNIRVINIEIMDIANPLGNRAVIRVVGDLTEVYENDILRVGPIPYSRLIIEGRVLMVDELRKEIIIDVSKVVSIPKEKVANLINRKLITLPEGLSIKEAAKILSSEKIRGAPVIDNAGNVIGMLTSADILNAVINDDINAPITKYMRKNVVSIKGNNDLLTAIKLMIKNNVGRLLVLNEFNKPIGIVTRTDILKKISGFDTLS